MGETEKQRPDGKPDDSLQRMKVGFAWAIIALLVLIGLAGIWLRGLEPEVIIGWVLLPLMAGMLLLVAYEARMTILVIGSLCVAALLYAASFFTDARWAVDPGLLWDGAYALVGFAIWLLVWDSREQRNYPIVVAAAGVACCVGLIGMGLHVAVFGWSFVASIKGLTTMAVILFLYGLTEKPWKTRIEVAALVACGLYVVRWVIDGMPFG